MRIHNVRVVRVSSKITNARRYSTRIHRKHYVTLDATTVTRTIAVAREVFRYVRTNIKRWNSGLCVCSTADQTLMKRVNACTRLGRYEGV